MSAISAINLTAGSAASQLTSSDALRMDAGRLRMSQMGGASFHAALATASSSERREAAEASARQLVASALISPVLSAMRESPFLQDGPFAPGTVEQRFAPMLDQMMADRITGAANFDLVRMIADKYAPIDHQSHATETHQQHAASDKKQVIHG